MYINSDLFSSLILFGSTRIRLAFSFASYSFLWFFQTNFHMWGWEECTRSQSSCPMTFLILVLVHCFLLYLRFCCQNFLDSCSICLLEILSRFFFLSLTLYTSSHSIYFSHQENRRRFVYIYYLMRSTHKTYSVNVRWPSRMLRLLLYHVNFIFPPLSSKPCNELA